MSLKISAKTEYACIAVMELAVHYISGGTVRVRDIAERHSVPPRFLVQILLQLKSADIVESVRGATGGYRLKRNPEDVTLGEVMRVVNPPVMRIKPFSGEEAPGIVVLHKIWDAAEQRRQDYLDRATLADLIREVGGIGR